MSKPMLKEAKEVLELYANPNDSSIDSGNLFFAATEYQAAYQQSLEIIKGLMGALEFYSKMESYQEKYYPEHQTQEKIGIPVFFEDLMGRSARKALTEAKEKLKTMGVEIG